MTTPPATVASYLRHHAPAGHLLCWWLDARRDYIVVILCEREGKHEISVGAFPEVVGHWGHQLGGMNCDLAEARLQLERGHWDVDQAARQRLLELLRCLEHGLDPTALLAECRAVYDPQGLTAPCEPPEPRAGPAMTHEAHFRVATDLVAALTHADTSVAAAAAARLGALGFTEDAGPLFVREALMRYRRTRPQKP